MSTSFKTVLRFPKILCRTAYISIMQFSRYLLHIIPVSLRFFILKFSLLLPLRLSKLCLNLVTRPIGDEWKWIHKIKQNTWSGVWIVPNLNSFKQAEEEAKNNDVVILYNHGGGFCIGHSKMYMETFQLIINHLRTEHQIRASILSLEYSLSPENVWPKACAESISAYRYLINTVGIHPSKIILAGDSAGGNLVATMLLTIKAQLFNETDQLVLPAAAAFISPWVELDLSNLVSTQKNEDIINLRTTAKALPHYIPNYKNLNQESKLSMLRNPLISPLYGDFSGTCPIFLAYGDKEFLRKSIEDFQLKLVKDGCNLTILKGENAAHVWLIYRLVSQSKQTYEKDCKVFINWIASVCNKIRIEN